MAFSWLNTTVGLLIVLSCLHLAFSLSCKESDAADLTKPTTKKDCDATVTFCKATRKLTEAKDKAKYACGDAACAAEGCKDVTDEKVCCCKTDDCDAMALDVPPKVVPPKPAADSPTAGPKPPPPHPLPLTKAAPDEPKSSASPAAPTAPVIQENTTASVTTRGHRNGNTTDSASETTAPKAAGKESISFFSCAVTLLLTIASVQLF